MPLRPSHGADARYKRIDASQQLTLSQKLNQLNDVGPTPTGGVQLAGESGAISGFGYACDIPLGHSFEIVFLVKNNNVYSGHRVLGEVVSSAGRCALNFGNAYDGTLGAPVGATFADLFHAPASSEWNGKWVQVSFGYDGDTWFTSVAGVRTNGSGELPPTAKPISIGRLCGGVYGGYGQFSGEVASIKLFNRALSEIERSNWITTLVPIQEMRNPLNNDFQGGAITSSSTSGCTVNNITTYLSTTFKAYDEPRPIGTKVKISCNITYSGASPLDTAKATPRLYGEGLEYASVSGTLHTWEFTSTSERLDTFPAIVVYCQSGGTAIISNYKVEINNIAAINVASPSSSQLLPAVSSVVIAGTGDGISQSATVTGTVATINAINSGYAWVYGNNTSGISVKAGDKIQVTFNLTSTGSVSSGLFGAWRLNNFAESIGGVTSHTVVGNKHTWEIEILYDSATLFVAPSVSGYSVGDVLTVSDFQVVKKNKGTKFAGELQYRGFKHDHTSWGAAGVVLSNVTASSFDCSHDGTQVFTFADVNKGLYLKKGQRVKFTCNLTKTGGDVRGLPGVVMWNYSYFVSYSQLLGEGYNEIILEVPSTGWLTFSVSQHGGVWANQYACAYTMSDITIDAIGTVASYDEDSTLLSNKWIDVSGNAFDLTPPANDFGGGVHSKRAQTSITRTLIGKIADVTVPAMSSGVFGEANTTFSVVTDYPEYYHLSTKFDATSIYTAQCNTLPAGLLIKSVWYESGALQVRIINTTTNPVNTGNIAIGVQQILS